AIEAVGEWFSEFDNDGRAQIARRLNQAVPHHTDHYDGWAATLNFKGYLLTGRYQPYIVVGLGYMEIDGHGVPDKSGPGGDFSTRYGIGMDACITEHIAIGPEVAYVLPFHDVNNMDLITVAL